MLSPRVILLGGAPMVGKSTVARKLAARLEYGCLSTDDLNQAISTVTIAASHPAFHEMDGIDYREYYLSRLVQELIADAERRHTALWPALAQLIRSHASWGDPIVIEGWALYPSQVTQLAFPNIISYWLIADDTVLEARVRAAVDFYRGASDEEAMIQHFVARSQWHNELLREEAQRSGMAIVNISPGLTAQEIVSSCSLC